MAEQAPIVVVAGLHSRALSAALADTRMFPLIDAGWPDALDAVARVQPAAVVVSAGEDETIILHEIARRLAAKPPYVPLIVIDPTTSLPPRAIPFASTAGNFERLAARLRAALRVRTLHATVMRRLTTDTVKRADLQTSDPVDDAAVLLIGRGAAYPALSVALGERAGVVGALSIEAAARHLNHRDIDGIVLGEGFSLRVMDAFLTVLAEDSRFRNLPVVVSAAGLVPTYELANLEMISGDSATVAATAMPLIWQRAFEARLSRTLKAMDSDGLLDAATGLLTRDAFDRDFAAAIYQTQSRGGGLCAARFSFAAISDRARLDAARILGRLMRQMDIGAVQDDGSIVVMFAETDLRSAQAIARRLANVMKHTLVNAKRERIDPGVTVTPLLPGDSAATVLARLRDQMARRAAS